MKSQKINYFKYFSLFFAIAVLVFIAGCGGASLTPIVNSFSADPTTITVGESSTLSWSVTDATSVTINQSIGSVALISTTTVSPATTTTYTLTATNAAGSVTAATTITVNPVAEAPIVNSFSALPSTITVGESSTLSWSVTDATSVTINQSIGSVALISTATVSPATTTTYTLTATNAVGSVTAATTITVNPAATLEITQTEGTNSAWFGASTTYVNVGQGQSFQVTEAGFFNQFQIYLTSTSSSDSGDIIVCNLRDASGNVLQNAYNSGFSAGNGGWQTFNFNLETYVTPGTYYCTCYVSNPIVDHWYSCHGNSDGASYPEGTRYDSRGGNPEDWSTWNPYTWDLVFKVIIKISP